MCGLDVPMPSMQGGRVAGGGDRAVCLLRPHRSVSSSFGACDSDASRGNVDIAVKYRLIESSTHVTASWKPLCGTRACVVSVVRALSQGLPKVWLDVGRLPLGDCEHVHLWG